MVGITRGKGKRMIMRTSTLLILLTISGAQVHGQQMRRYQDSTIRCIYEVNNGRFHGSYISYYNNGIKKAEGRFDNNNRVGKWSVWDSTGVLRMKRNYENPFVFERLVPPVPKDKLVKLLNKPRYRPVKGADGVNIYSNLYENYVFTSKRLWRKLKPDNNAVLFKNQRLINILYENIENDSISAYSTKGDQFKIKLDDVKIDRINNKVIAYRIKEDWFFDRDRMISETRIIGICPIVFNQESKDTLELFWIYYPQLRQVLAREKVKVKSTNINTLEDVFFYRHFTSTITKESNVYDRELGDYCKRDEIEKEAERIEISILELEHKIWLSFTRAAK